MIALLFNENLDFISFQTHTIINSIRSNSQHSPRSSWAHPWPWPDLEWVLELWACHMFLGLNHHYGKPSFKKIKKIMENSIIQKNKVYFNTRPLFEAIKSLIFFKTRLGVDRVKPWNWLRLVVACRIIVSAPILVPFLWFLDFRLWTWIWT